MKFTSAAFACLVLYGLVETKYSIICLRAVGYSRTVHGQQCLQQCRAPPPTFAGFSDPPPRLTRELSDPLPSLTGRFSDPLPRLKRGLLDPMARLRRGLLDPGMIRCMPVCSGSCLIACSIFQNVTNRFNLLQAGLLRPGAWGGGVLAY